MKGAGSAWGTHGVQAGFVVGFVLLWIYVGRTTLVNPIFVPPFERVVEEFVRIIVSGEVFAHLAVTLTELAVAYGIASALGLTVGYAIGRSRFAVAVFEPLLAGLYAVPLVIFLPLFILILGLGSESKMAFGATLAFFPIVLNTIGGVSQVDSFLVTVARSLGATDAQMFKRVFLPAALPVIITGIRIGFILGFLAILGAEMIASFAGLGNQIVRLAEGMRMPQMFAYVLFVILIATLLNGALSYMQARFSHPSGGA